MNRFAYTNLAKGDLLDIGQFSIGTFGVIRAARYLEDLEQCCELLARMPAIGRFWRHRGREFRRIEINKHVIFYREKDHGILVVRILHHRMVPAKQSFDEK